MKSFETALVLFCEAQPVGVVLKDHVIGAVVSTDNEYCIDILLKDGSKFQYFTGETIDDELPRIVLEMGWH